jgi:hypothetical protein
MTSLIGILIFVLKAVIHWFELGYIADIHTGNTLLLALLQHYYLYEHLERHFVSLVLSSGSVIEMKLFPWNFMVNPPLKPKFSERCWDLSQTS